MSGGEAVKQLSVAVVAFCLLFATIAHFTPDVPMVRRQYPHGGLIKELGSIEENKVRSTHLLNELIDVWSEF